MSDATCTACGWAAAFGSMLAFGSFGVPIKASKQRVETDPLVFQTYKTLVCFLTSWLVLLFGAKFTFTPWGIVSGLFWVPGGVAAIYAIQNAGLAVSIGIGSSLIVLVSFIWGIYAFDEHVRSRVGALMSIYCMMLGLAGMAYYSSSGAETSTTDSLADDTDEDSDAADEIMVVEDKIVEKNYGTIRDNPRQALIVRSGAATSAAGSTVAQPGVMDDPADKSRATHSVIFGMKLSRRYLGMLAAMFNGIWGGSILAPMKWCSAETRGVGFLISFAIGSSIVTLGLWVGRYCYNVYRHRSLRLAYAKLPSFHCRIMFVPGMACGLMWSIGNFFSLISVFYLGEGVGYPLVQSSLLVSGLWGILYFKEIKGRERIVKWILSSLVTLIGIIFLGYEHMAG